MRIYLLRCSFWGYIVLSEALQHDVLLERDGYMWFSERSYRKLLPHPGDNLAFGELTLSRQNPPGAVAFLSDCSASTGDYHLLYAGDRGVSLSRVHQLVHVSLVRNSRTSAWAGNYLVDMLRGPAKCSVDKNLVENGLRHTP